MSNSIYVVEKKIFASDGDRFINCILDFVFILVTLFVITFLIVIVGNIIQWDIFRIWKDILTHLGPPLVFLSFSIFYYLVFKALFRRAIAKFITRTIVVNKNGLKPGFGAIFIRTLCRLIPFDALSFLGKSGRIWHDSISNTYVVYKKDLKRDKEMFYDLNLIGINELD